MSQSDRSSEASSRSGAVVLSASAYGASSAAAAVGSKPAEKNPEKPESAPAKQSDKAIDPAERPGASGHRFGPDLACSECGIQWDAHQREPAPCTKDEPADAFLRRPD